MRRFLLSLTLAVCPAFASFSQCTFDLRPPVDYPIGADTRHFVIANLNGDPWPDAAFRVDQTDKIRILLGTQGGGFAAGKDITVGRILLFELEAGDLDNDGKTDLVATNNWIESPWAMPAVIVLRGKGDGTFHPGLTYDVSQMPDHLSLADFNNDGKLDVAVGKASSFALLLGKGDGTLAKKADVTLLPELSHVYRTDAIAHGDFDKDGKMDVAVAESATFQLHVFWGVGDGTFKRGPRLPLPDELRAEALTAGDYDGDGDTDLAYAQMYETQPLDYSLIVFRSNGSARTFAEGARYGDLSGGAMRAASADIDADGDLDILLATLWHSTVMFNDGTGAFPVQEAYGDVGAYVAAADVNRDGGLDLIAASAGFYIYVLLNDCSRAGLTLTSTPNPSAVNTNATFTGTVVPPAIFTPTGTLTLKRGATVLASGNIAVSPTVSATLDSLPAGTHTITAIYSGDANFNSETKKIEHVVELPPFGAPANLTAFSSGGPVNVSWMGTQGVSYYEIWRRGGGAGWALLGTTQAQSFMDSTASPSAAWIYKVRGVPSPGSMPSPFSNADLASTFVFTDETITAGVTKVKRDHVADLRNAVDAARIAAGLTAAAWTDNVPNVVKAVHFTELRTALEQARAAIGMPAGSYTSVAAGTSITAVNVTQLRTALR